MLCMYSLQENIFSNNKVAVTKKFFYIFLYAISQYEGGAAVAKYSRMLRYNLR